MKKLMYLLSAATMLAACDGNKSHSGFELKGTLKNAEGQTVYLEKLSSQKTDVIDSAVLGSNGEYVLNSASPSLGFYRLKVSNSSFAMLVLDSAEKVTLNGDAKDLGNSYTVEGSPNTSLFREYDKMAQLNKGRLDSIENLFRTMMVTMKMDSLKADSLSKELEAPYKAIMKGYSDKLAVKIKENNSSFASIMAISQLDPADYLSTYTDLDKGLMQKYPANSDVKKFHDMVVQTETMVKRAEAIAIGATAPEISLPTPAGPPLALSSLRGKVVLIDFWASWCGPCRKEMPNVKKVYAKYKNKGFEIFGVSLDQERAAWLEAIEKDGLAWPQVSDLKYWQSAAVPDYAVQAIPFTVLLDKEGKIIAKNLRGEELDKKLAEVLK